GNYEIITKYNIYRHDFFLYLQVRNYILKNATTKMSLIVKISDLRPVTGVYVLTFLKETWEKELSMEISNEAWSEAWENAKYLSVCNKVKATQLKMSHRGHIPPHLRHRFNPDLSPLCPKRRIEVNLTHCLCRKIQQFWFSIQEELDKIFISTECNPMYMLLGFFRRAVEKHLYRTVLYRKCLSWITDKAPSKTQWQQTVLEFVLLDFLTSKLHNRENVFHNI
uniref:Uncharacterized protein n=1 Tax=Poecilia formosa TaxID=48698 RepID=A0A096LQC2_POEFO